MNRYLLFAAVICLTACHSGNPNAPYSGGSAVNPGTVGSLNHPPAVNLPSSGIPSIPGLPPGLDPSDVSLPFKTCTDLGSNPQYHEVDLNLRMSLSKPTPATYVLTITDAQGNSRILPVVGDFAETLTNGAYVADFQSGNDKIHYSLSADNTGNYGPLVLTENGKTAEIVCSTDPGSWLNAQVTELIQFPWCSQQNGNTLKYAFTSDGKDFGTKEPAGGTITATIYKGNWSTDSQFSQVQGTWQLFQGQLALKFSDGTSKTVPALYLDPGDLSASTTEWHFDFPDHKEVYLMCPDNPSLTQN